MLELLYHKRNPIIHENPLYTTITRKKSVEEDIIFARVLQ